MQWAPPVRSNDGAVASGNACGGHRPSVGSVDSPGSLCRSSHGSVPTPCGSAARMWEPVRLVTLVAEDYERIMYEDRAGGLARAAACWARLGERWAGPRRGAARWSPRKLRRLADLSHRRRYGRGDVVVDEGAPARLFYLVDAGRAEVRRLVCCRETNAWPLSFQAAAAAGGGTREGRRHVAVHVCHLGPAPALPDAEGHAGRLSDLYQELENRAYNDEDERSSACTAGEGEEQETGEEEGPPPRHDWRQCLTPHFFFGEDGLLGHTTHQYRVVAREDNTEVFQINIQDFLLFINQDDVNRMRLETEARYVSEDILREMLNKLEKHCSAIQEYTKTANHTISSRGTVSHINVLVEPERLISSYKLPLQDFCAGRAPLPFLRKDPPPAAVASSSWQHRQRPSDCREGTENGAAALAGIMGSGGISLAAVSRVPSFDTTAATGRMQSQDPARVQSSKQLPEKDVVIIHHTSAFLKEGTSSNDVCLQEDLNKNMGKKKKNKKRNSTTTTKAERERQWILRAMSQQQKQMYQMSSF
mmetsp:Transcript_51673/g.88953  ORF Transcript_51673/g.88953 Transcript_51673/m.88953 type:complete len:532 (-) Transcript_51673:131-1726(-)